MSVELLGRQNPWWVDRRNIDQDPYLVEFESSPSKWSPDFLLKVNLNQDVVYVILGPRQVGKTTSFKLLIRNLLESEEQKPRGVLYLNCDEIAPQTPQKLSELINEYLSWSKELPGRHYVFIDEATYLRDWERGIKILADRGLLHGVTVFATGSHLMGLRRGAERLPGRRGRGKELDIYLYPLSFREYVVLHKNELKDKIPNFRTWDTQNIWKAGQELSLYHDEIISLFESYLRTGGFLRAIREYRVFSNIKPDIYKLYRDGFIGDLVRMGRRETLFRELAQWIINRRENPFEWSDAARETYLGTHPTVREYIEDAEASFVWDVFYKLKEMGRPFRAPRSPKKVYFKDPFIFHALRAWTLGFQDPYRAQEEFLKDPVNLGYLVENLVASHLKRIFGDNVYYWRNGGEIDFVIFEEGRKKALLEVKYQKSVSPENFKVLNQWGKGLILTQNNLGIETGNLFMPVAYFLALLG